MSPATTTRPTTRRAAAPAQATRSRPRRLVRRLMQAVAVLSALALLGVTVQAIAERRDAAAHPAPGEHVELPDGRRLHLQVAGEEHDGPTVVLEAGAGGFSSAWGWIQPAVAEHATVVAYDRAGLGWSDESGHGPDAEAVIDDLQAALAARGLPGPYILGGHSLGGHYVRAFADALPYETAGVVLVDPSHEHQSALTGSPEDHAVMFAALRAATRLGLTRLLRPFMAGELEALPEPQRSEALAHVASTANSRAQTTEMLALDRIGALLPGEDGALGDVPLRVLSAAGGARDDDEAQMLTDLAELRAGMAALSTDGDSIVLADAAHVTIVTEQEHAAVVTAAILDVVDRAR
jgi:pimeloyl-ACP methyl ester carboxylesterase